MEIMLLGKSNISRKGSRHFLAIDEDVSCDATRLAQRQLFRGKLVQISSPLFYTTHSIEESCFSSTTGAHQSRDLIRFDIAGHVVQQLFRAFWRIDNEINVLEGEYGRRRLDALNTTVILGGSRAASSLLRLGAKRAFLPLELFFCVD